MPSALGTNAEIGAAIADHRKTIRAALADVHPEDMGERIYHIYYLAGAESVSAAGAQARKMTKDATEAIEHLKIAERLLGRMGSTLKAAVAFSDDAETRRKHTASAYRV
jgi:hypothetical protein